MPCRTLHKFDAEIADAEVNDFFWRHDSADILLRVPGSAPGWQALC